MGLTKGLDNIVRDEASRLQDSFAVSTTGTIADIQENSEAFPNTKVHGVEINLDWNVLFIVYCFGVSNYPLEGLRQ